MNLMIKALVIPNLCSFDLNHPVTPTFYELSPRNMFTDSSIPVSCDPTSLLNKIFQSYLGFGSVKGTGTPNISLGILNDGNGMPGNFRMVEPQGVPCPLGGQIQEPFRQTFQKHGTHNFSGRKRRVKKKNDKKLVPGTVGWYGIHLYIISHGTTTWIETNSQFAPETLGLKDEVFFSLRPIFRCYVIVCFGECILDVFLSENVWTLTAFMFDSFLHHNMVLNKIRPCKILSHGHVPVFFFTKQTSLSFRKAKSSKTHINTHPSYMMLTWYVVWIAFIIFSIPSYPILSTCEEITFLQQKKAMSSMGCQVHLPTWMAYP